LTDSGGAEAGARAVAGARVERGADEGNVELHLVAGEAGEVGQAPEGGNSGEDGVGLGAAVAGEAVVPGDVSSEHSRRPLTILLTRRPCEGRKEALDHGCHEQERLRSRRGQRGEIET
jgi:hypothetical protein